MLATDGAGAVIWKENYRPYGERPNNQAGSGKNKLGFAGKQFDTALQVVAKSTSKTFPLLDKDLIADHLDVSNRSLAPVELTAIAIK
nr:hypothetical protein [uncultured Rhodoferax sp.]